MQGKFDHCIRRLMTQSLIRCYKWDPARNLQEQLSHPSHFCFFPFPLLCCLPPATCSASLSLLYACYFLLLFAPISLPAANLLSPPHSSSNSGGSPRITIEIIMKQNMNQLNPQIGPIHVLFCPSQASVPSLK